MSEYPEDEYFTLPDFTGNWFIDANIYGFYRCIKESGIEDVLRKEDSGSGTAYYFDCDGKETILIKYSKEANLTIEYHPIIVYGIYPFYYAYKHLNVKIKKLIQIPFSEIFDQKHKYIDILKLLEEPRDKQFNKAMEKIKELREERETITSVLNNMENKENVELQIKKISENKLYNLEDETIKKKLSKNITDETESKILGDIHNLKKGITDKINLEQNNVDEYETKLIPFIDKLFDDTLKKFNENKYKKTLITHLEKQKEKTNLKDSKKYSKKLETDDIKKNSGFSEMAFYTNYSFFKQIKNKDCMETFEDGFKSHLGFQTDGQIHEKLFSKTGNKYMFSNQKFAYQNFAKPTIPNTTIVDSEDRSIFPELFCLINFPGAFSKIKRRNKFFYSPDKEFTFKVNDKIKQSLTDMKTDTLQTKIFDLISSSFLELKTKSWFSLNQMYIVEYGSIYNQELLNVDFIGFPKHASTILSNPKILKALNRYEVIKLKENKKRWHYLLQEFVVRKSLTELYLKKFRIERKLNIFNPNIIHLALDALTFEHRNHRVYSQYTLSGEQDKFSYILRDMNLTKNMFKRCFRNHKEKAKFMRYLAALVSSKQLSDFKYALTKEFMGLITKEKDKERYSKYISKLNQNTCWEAYAAVAISGINGGE